MAAPPRTRGALPVRRVRGVPALVAGVDEAGRGACAGPLVAGAVVLPPGRAGIVPGLNTLAWDLQGYDVTSWYGTLVKGIFNLGPQMTVLEVITYVGYLVPTMFLSTGEPSPVQADTASPSPQSAAVAH